MNTENQESKTSHESDCVTPPTQDDQVARTLVVPQAETTAAAETTADSSRSPGVQDRDAIAPTPLPDSSQPAPPVRKLVVSEGVDSPKSNDPRSPGVQDRDAIAPTPLPDSSQPAPPVRKLVVPEGVDSPKSNDPRSPGVQDRDLSTPPNVTLPTDGTKPIRNLVVPEETTEVPDSTSSASTDP